MADSTHTLEIELRTKDFATASLKRVGEAGKEAGAEIAKGMDEAGASTKTFSQRWLKLDGDFKAMAKVGVMSMSAVSAGISTATADGEDLGKTMLSTGASIAGGFASGGLVGGALAATGALIGGIVNAFTASGRAAEAAAQQAADAWKRASDRIGSSMSSGLKEIDAAQARAAERERSMAIDREVILGTTREAAAAAYDQAKAINDAKIALDKALYTYQNLKVVSDGTAESAKALAKASADVGFKEQALQIAQNETQEIQKQVVLRKAAEEIERDRLKVEQESAAIAKAAADEAWRRTKAGYDAREALQREAIEMIRLSKLSKDELEVDRLRQMEEQLRLSNRKDLADEIRKMIDAQLKELQAARDTAAAEKARAEGIKSWQDMLADNEYWKGMSFFADESGRAKKNMDSMAKTDLAAPIRAAAEELKKMETRRAPGRGGAQFDEEGKFLGLGLAEARQERRDALRSRKRRRAEAGRMGFALGETAGMRTGRRAGGLGAFSDLEGGGGDMGIVEPGDEGTPSFFAAKRKRKTFVPPPKMAQLPIIGGGAGVPGAQLDLQLFDKQTGATKTLADQMKVLSDNAKAQADNLGTAASAGEDIIGEAVRAAEAAGRIADNMGQVVVKVSDLAERLESVEQRTERLLEAARLRGGN